MAITVVERHPCRDGSARKEGKIQNRQLRLETTRALNRGEKMPRKERMPGVFGQNPNIQPMRWRGAGIEILREERHTTRVRQHVLMQSAKLLRRHRKIVVPPDRRLGQRVADDKFVVRRSPCVGAGFHDESARRGCDSLAASDRFAVEFARLAIPTSLCEEVCVFDRPTPDVVCSPHRRVRHPEIFLTGSLTCDANCV